MGCDDNAMDRRLGVTPKTDQELNDLLIKVDPPYPVPPCPPRNTVETVNHPAHYGGGDNPYEVIKVIRAWGLGFNLGTVVKYIGRDAGSKVVAMSGMLEARTDVNRIERKQRLDDLRKAAWYLNDEIKNLEKEMEK